MCCSPTATWTISWASAGLLSTFLRWEAIEELEIFGGRAALDRVHDLLYGVVLRGNQPPMPLQFREIKPGTFFEAKDFTVTAFPVSHRGPDCLGYIFEERARRPFLPEKADELGDSLRPGTPRPGGRQGRWSCRTGGASARRTCWDPLQKGAKLVVIGDTGRTDDLVQYARDADALVIESTYLNEEAEMARQFSHLTAQQAAELARARQCPAPDPDAHFPPLPREGRTKGSAGRASAMYRWRGILIRST